MKYFVTGGAGFIGSHLVDYLMKRDHQVTVYDNLSSGCKRFIAHHFCQPGFRFIQADLLDLNTLRKAIGKHDIVFHLAANPDIRYGITHPDTDLKQGTLTTFNVLEAMRQGNVSKIVFSSSSVVYGEPTVIPTPENYGPLVPVSLYGASKLAGEGLITAYAHTFDMKAWIFRLANIVGSRSTHGIIIDFINKLKKNPEELEILGDGRQSKSFLLVEECIEGIFYGVTHSRKRVNIFNLGGKDQISATKIARILIAESKRKGVKFRYTGGRKGWEGDVTIMKLAVDRMKRLGWEATKGSGEAVRSAIRSLLCRP